MATHPQSDDRRYDLLVLDWDGTVMDSLGAIVACAQHGLRQVGLGQLPDELIRGGIGLGLEVTVRRLLPDADDAIRARWVHAYRTLWVEVYRHQPVALPGAPEAVAELDRQEYLLAVATGKGRRGLTKDLQELALDRYFLATRTVDEAPSKPHPQMLLEILDELGIAADRALMVGDTTFDLEMARNAGVDGVGVLCGSHGREALMGVGARACLERLADLPAWLARDASRTGPPGS